ncbi:hypothetical protein DFH08DRAFT_824416 [Mycena albidolilacea]|uniref:Uncharacterized protein n=1 Tax=Mycena albidolilacea TaxID=1033008 RepID=A0AAD7EAC8_9AGAR|nr:hypothetical protein DFH08DRAFT_824416 [Mycena albidolilacea]
MVESKIWYFLERQEMVGKLLTHGYIPMEVNVVVSDWGEVDLLRVGQVKAASVLFEFQSEIADMTVTAEFTARQKDADHATASSSLSPPNARSASCFPHCCCHIVFVTMPSPPLSRHVPLKREKTREQPEMEACMSRIPKAIRKTVAEMYLWGLCEPMQH